MSEIEDVLDSEFLRFKNATYYRRKNELVLEILCRDGEDIDEENKKKLQERFCNFLGDKSKINLEFKKSYLDENVLLSILNAKIEKDFSNLKMMFNLDKTKIIKEQNKFTICFYVFENFLQSKSIEGFCEELRKDFSSEYCYDFNVITVKDERINLSKILEEKVRLEQEEIVEVKMEKFKIFNKELIVGKEIDEKDAKLIYTIPEEKNVCTFGVVHFLQERTYIKKSKDKDGNEKESEKIRITFVLKELGTEVSCVAFPSEKSIEKFRLLENGNKVLVCGDFETRNEYKSFLVRDVAKCDFEIEQIEQEKKSVAENYVRVFPERYVDVEQASLFDVELAVKNKELKEKTFVVFDLETTGLDYSTNRIVEIGAVKVVNGKIVEQFASFVNPQMPIPPDATRINNITDAMVADAPIFAKIVADFFKFCDGTELVGQNVTFDLGFLRNEAGKAGYDFSHSYQDTLLISRAKIKKIRNYKLKTLCEYFNINLTNAHRAFNDAAATAKVFIKLLENF